MSIPLLVLLLSATVPQELPPQEKATRAKCEGRTLYTVPCGLYWHVPADCPEMDPFRSFAPLIVLTMKEGELKEGDKPSRFRTACPKCVGGS
jgi:hypothetical protein